MAGIFDALTDPGVDALLGMTQGFAQAALPTRMPTPLGAVLGMGAGGILPAVAQGQTLQKAGIENQRSKMLMDWYKQNYGGGQGAAGAPLGMPQQGNANGMYLRSPQQIAGMGDLAMATGQDRSAATLYGLPNTMAGGAGYAMGPGGVAFPTPGGAADPNVVGTKAAAQAFGTRQGEASTQPPITIKVPDGRGGYNEQTMTPQQLNQTLNGGQPGATPSSVPAGAIPASDWATRLGGTENATGNPAAKNPRSSATGNGQFIDSTWIDQVRKQYPDQTARMTDPQILAQRSDPILSHQMTMAYGAENAGALGDAGIPPNSTTLAAAHKLGPGDAVKVLGAARTMPQTPLSSILSPAVIAANPRFARQTAGSYVFGLSGQFGAAPVDFGRGAPRVAPGLMAGPGAPSASAQSMPGIAGPPVLTPQQEAAQKVDTEAKIAAAKFPYQQDRVSAGGVLAVGGKPVFSVPRPSEEVIPDGPYKGMRGTVLRDPMTNTIVGATPNPGQLSGPRADVTPPANPDIPTGFLPSHLAPDVQEKMKTLGELPGEDINHDRKIVEEDLGHVLGTAQPAQQQLLMLRDLSARSDPGALGEFRNKVKNYVQTFSPGLASSINWDAAPGQELMKNALLLSGRQENHDLGARGGYNVTKLYLNANPGIETQPEANREMSTALIIAHQRDIDYAQGATNHYQINRAAFEKSQGAERYNPVIDYDTKFIGTMKPELYYSAINAMNGKPEAVWGKGLSPEQHQIVAGIIQRADPSASINVGGRIVPISAVRQVIDPSQIMAPR